MIPEVAIKAAEVVAKSSEVAGAAKTAETGKKAVDIAKRVDVGKTSSSEISKSTVDIRKRIPVKDIKETPEKMEPPVRINFKCPEGLDKAEFKRQLKAQERGLNSQTLSENIDNRNAYEERKKMSETGNGRAPESAEAQRITREKAFQSRIKSNIEKGMSYKEASKEASAWIKTQAAIHNPDQIAGGDPLKVSKMGDAKVNSSIGGQWKSRVDQMGSQINDYAKNFSKEELSKIKMNVRLEVE